MTNEQRFRGCSWLSLLLAVALFHSAHANGNVISEGGKAFTYDSDNHLVTVGSPTATIVYDGFGNRVAKTVTANGVPTTTLYLVDELNPTGYAQVVEELSSAGAVERQYTYGLQRIDENQRIESVWTASFYGYDGGGSVRQLTSSAGAVTDSYEYDAFGNALVTSGSTPNSYLYRGEQYDPDLGLYYLRARYYNPGTGRFMSRDPNDPQLIDANGIPTDPRSLHKYLYANGDPINGIDPKGRATALQYAFLLNVVAWTDFVVYEYSHALGKLLICEEIALLVATGNPILGGIGGAVVCPWWFPPPPPPKWAQ